MTKDIERAFENGRAWYQTIVEMVADLSKAEDQDNEGGADETEAPRRRIEESPLSVMVRDGWRQPGAPTEEGPEEYEILLSTGGPALRIWGQLDGYNQPDTAELQAQDWGTQWTRVPDCDPQVLRSFAGVFYYGEG